MDKLWIPNRKAFHFTSLGMLMLNGSYVFPPQFVPSFVFIKFCCYEEHQGIETSFLLYTMCFLMFLFHFAYQTHRPTIDPTETL